jgi:hypothetical protein
MNRNRLLKHLVFLMFFIFLANSLALKLHWYSLVWYFDIIMHTLGGLWVGMFFLYVLERNKAKPMNLKLVMKVILATLAVGLIWEAYEFYIYQHLSQNPFDLADTLSDLLCDIIGAVLACVYFLKLIVFKRIDKVQSN